MDPDRGAVCAGKERKINKHVNDHDRDVTLGDIMPVCSHKTFEIKPGTQCLTLAGL